MNDTRKCLCLIACMIFVSGITAQTAEKVILLDEYNARPIQGITFKYGNQQGISDENGIITFRMTEGEVMKLSHVNYGSWEWDEAELAKVIRQGKYYRESLTYNLYPVTVIGVRPDQNAAEKIKIDYQDRMEHDAAAILNQIPAMNSIRKSGNYGFDPVFRGFKYDRLIIVWNGAQGATAACPNRMDPPTSQMAPNMLDRIEILKGPHALRFGTGFGGTVNFIPSELRFTDHRDVTGRISSEYLGNGNILRSEAQIGLSGRNYDLGLFSAWSQGDDYKAGNDQIVQADFRRGSFGTNLGLKLTPNQQLRLSALYNLARDVDFPALPMDLRDDDTWLFNARHDMNMNSGNLKSWNTTLFGSFVKHLMNNLLKPLDPRTLNTETAAGTYNYGGRTEGIWHVLKGELFTGADLHIERARGTRVREFLAGPNAGNTFRDNVWQNSCISKAGLFFEYQLHASAFQYIFSARLEINHADTGDPSEEFTRIYKETRTTQVNPNVSIGVIKGFGNSIKTGLWFGRAERSGSLTERFINYFPVGQDPYEMLGNPQLHPEVNNQMDLTFKWSTKETVLDVDLFASYLQDFISSIIEPAITPRLPASPGVRKFVNIAEAFKTGFELNWIQDLPFGLQYQLGFAYTYAQDLERDEPLPEVAPLDSRFTLRGSYLDKKLLPEITFRRVMEQSRISHEFGETVTPSFSLLDVKIAWQPSGKIRFSAGINNVLDESYYEHLNRAVRGTSDPIYAPGRNFMASINLSF